MNVASVSATVHNSSARHLLNAVNRASDTVTSACLIYLGLTAYFIIALASVTHKDLLLNSLIPLPILGISITLDRFFLFAPPLFILIHIGMMMYYAIMTRKLHAFLAGIEEEERIAARDQDTHNLIHPLRYELSSNFFVQYLAGSPQSWILAFFQQYIVWLTLVLLAVIVLLFFQIAFLPYHDIALTWAHRIYVVADLGLVALIGTFLTSPLTGFWSSFGFAWRTYPVFMLITAASFSTFFAISLFVATLPGEAIGRSLAAYGPSIRVAAPSGRADDDRYVFWPTAYLFEGSVDPETGKCSSLFQRNFVVMNQNLSAATEQAAGIGWISLRFRDLRYSRLDRSDLSQVDLTGADLTGASLKGTKMSVAPQQQ